MAALLVVAGCSAESVSTTGSSSTIGGDPISTITVTTQSEQVDTGDVRGFPVQEVSLGGEDWLVAVADNPGRRARGLMGVEDMGDLDGMLFVFEAPTSTSFWMKDTVIPLDVALFDERGRLFEVVSMEPCAADPCPAYTAGARFAWALEAPAGSMNGLEEGVQLVIDY